MNQFLPQILPGTSLEVLFGQCCFRSWRSKKRQEFICNEACNRKGLTGLGVTYATAAGSDEEMAERIARHRKDRPASVATIEEPLDAAKALLSSSGTVCILDCITLLITNIMYSVEGFDSSVRQKVAEAEEAVYSSMEKTLKACAERDGDTVVVSNEVGVGIVPAYADGRVFQDLAGFAHQKIAEAADEVYYMTAGIPVKVK